ncbi:MAG: hypothetical protein ACJ735_03720 [Actinomycetes bacterium]
MTDVFADSRAKSCRHIATAPGTAQRDAATNSPSCDAAAISVRAVVDARGFISHHTVAAAMTSPAAAHIVAVV